MNIVLIILLSISVILSIFVVIKINKMIKRFNNSDESFMKNLINIFKNIESLDKKSTDRYTYQFQQFSNYLNERDKFFVEQLKNLIKNANDKMDQNLLEDEIENQPIKKEKKKKQITIDDILDKISKVGMEKLSEEELKILKNNNKK